jgi:hypothetical protein
MRSAERCRGHRFIGRLEGYLNTGEEEIGMSFTKTIKLILGIRDTYHQDMYPDSSKRRIRGAEWEQGIESGPIDVLDSLKTSVSMTHLFSPLAQYYLLNHERGPSGCRTELSYEDMMPEVRWVLPCTIHAAAPLLAHVTVTPWKKVVNDRDLVRTSNGPKAPTPTSPFFRRVFVW